MSNVRVLNRRHAGGDEGLSREVLGRIVAALETQHNRIRGFWGRQSRRRGVGKDDSAQPVPGKR